MTDSTTALHAAIRAADDNLESTFGQGDSQGMSGLYTEDGMLLPTGSEPVRGKPDIQAFWQGAMDMGIKRVGLEIVELEDHGSTAIEVGNYTLTSEGGEVIDRGKYVVVWKQKDGNWKLHRDIWNTNTPA